jgi:hypothetical protein
MTLVKSDRPRPIDRVIDYFGDSRHGALTDPRPDEGSAVRLERLAEART